MMKPRAHLIYNIVAVVVFTLFCSACEVIFINPLPVAPDAKPDERLEGKWHARHKIEHKLDVQFESGANMLMNVSIFSEDKTQNPVFTMTTVKIGKRCYMNLKPTDKKYENKGYLILRYEVEGNQLIVWTLDAEKVKAAIKQGRLKGESGLSEKDATTISDTPERVAAFLGSAAGDEAFQYEETFDKIRRDH